MANQEHLDILKQGVVAWNKWRKEHPDIRANLKGADLSGTDLSEAHLISAYLRRADMREANLSRVHFSKADLREVDFSGANLTQASFKGANLKGAKFIRANISQASFIGADLSKADITGAYLKGARLKEAILNGVNLSQANLSQANLSGAHLINANLSEVDLEGARLIGTILIGTNLTKAILTNCSIYGISAWNVKLSGATQSNLNIALPYKSKITVDNLKVAQFIHLLLNNIEIRDLIDTITSKVVLILGRFNLERKIILDAIRDVLRKLDYVPILFDFEKPASRDITETVSTLAHMARFVIADITEPRSIPQELSHIVPFLPSVPIMPLLQVSEDEYGMYEHFSSYSWVQPIYHYYDLDELLNSMQEKIINPAERKVKELAIEKAKRLERP